MKKRLLTGVVCVLLATVVIVGQEKLASFSVKEAKIESVFNMLAQLGGHDIVLSENVTGTVTLQLSNKSWEEIFAIVCRMHNLRAVTEPSYTYVLTKDEYQEQMLKDATGNSELEKIANTQQRMIRLNNVPADAMKESLEALLSDRGTITVVEHTNSLIIQDVERNIEQIELMISQTDKETQQVSISCKIIEVSAGTLENMGIQWGGDIEAVSFNHLAEPATSVINKAVEKLTYGILTPQQLQVTMEYLFQDNKSKIVAQPQITTLDNMEAKVFTGSQVPFRSVDEGGNIITEFFEAGTELTVTPHITSQGRIRLDLNPKKQSAELTSEGPIIREQSAKTNVVVGDGSTVVIAGLTTDEEQSSEEGIPFLKDIPIIGRLFKRMEARKSNNDLIIFVTPNVIKPQILTNAKAAD